MDIEAYWRDLDAYLDSVPERVSGLKSELRQEMNGFDAFDVIGNLLFANLPLNPETYRESTHEGLMAFVECAALVLLERPNRRGTDGRDSPIGAKEMDAWMPRLQEIVSLSLLAETRRVTPEPRSNDPLAEVRGHVARRELLLRNPVYDWQEEATLRALFDNEPVRNALLATVGFSINDALTLLDALTAIGLQRLGERARTARDHARRMKENLKSPRRDDGVGDDADRKALAQLRALPADQAREWIDTMLIAWAWLAVGDTLQVTAHELAEHTGVEESRAAAFLDFFAVEFGIEDDTGVFTGHHVLRRRPIIHDGEGHYLCTYVGNVLFAIRPRLEDALKPSGNDADTNLRWSRYNRVRTEYVEQHSVRLLAGGLRTSQAWTNVNYTIDGDGPFELDGLVVLDSVAFLIEAKGASLSLPARRGAPERLNRDIERILGSASEQAERLRQALEDGRQVALKASDGSRIPLTLANLSRLFSVVVTLDDFSGFGPTVWELVEAELLAVPAPLPWIVSLHELEVIADLIEYPAMLPHYLMRRRRLNELKLLRAEDELDFFIHYLERGLFFDEMLENEPEPPNAIFLHSLTDDLDAYYMWKRGNRQTPAKKPHQRMNRQFREIIEALEATSVPGRTEVEIALLAMPDDDRKNFAKTFGQMRARSATDDQLHDATMGYGPPENRGVTVMTAPTTKTRLLRDRLPSYCLMKKYQVGANEWIGVAGTPDDVIAGIFVAQSPWSPDHEMERIVAELPTATEARGFTNARTDWLATQEG